jgi:hydrogenase nickel incorporation protein HypA/HybF
MHELSIVQSVVQSVSEWLSTQPAQRVKTVNLRVGVLSGVARDALLFSYEIAAADTPLAGSALTVRTVPIVLYCPHCDTLGEMEGTQRFRCPRCGAPTGDVRQGREIEIESLEIEDGQLDTLAAT